MNPGPIEAGERVASGFMAIMKDQPLSLALVIMNLVLLLLFFYIAKVATENRRSEFQILQENQKEVNKLLFNCVPVERERR